jgi:hypothetical protein
MNTNASCHCTVLGSLCQMRSNRSGFCSSAEYPERRRLRLTYHTATMPINPAHHTRDSMCARKPDRLPHTTRPPSTPSTISNDGERPELSGLLSGELADVVVCSVEVVDAPLAPDTVVALVALDDVIGCVALDVIGSPIVVGEASDDVVGDAGAFDEVAGGVDVGAVSVVDPGGNAVPQASLRRQVKWYSNK